MNIEEILGNQNKQEYDKEAYAQKKYEERMTLNKLIDDMVDKIKLNIDDFKKYLDVQVKFPNYSVSNALLVTAQFPEATQLKSYDSWRNARAYVNKKPIYVNIFEYSDTYTRKDGTVAPSYNVKKMIDVSQTSLKQVRKAFQNYDDKNLLKAFLTNSNANIQVVNNLEDLVKYNKSENVLYISRTSPDTKLLFNTLSKELAKMMFEPSQDYRIDELKADCVSYMICKRYNIDVSDYQFNIDGLANLDVKDIKTELNSIKSAYQDMESSMQLSLDSLSKNSKVYER